MGATSSKCASSEAGTLEVSRPGVDSAPPSAIRPPLSPTGPASTTLKPRVAPRWMIGSTRSRCCEAESMSVPGAAASRVRASAVSLLASATTAVTRWSSRPSRVCCSRNQPTMLTTTAESTTVLATTRAWIDRRQKVRPRRRPAGRLREGDGAG